MPTVHPRINITLKPDVAAILTALADEAEQSVSALARELITEALALREDKALSALADSRDAERRTEALISHKDAWG